MNDKKKKSLAPICFFSVLGLLPSVVIDVINFNYLAHLCVETHRCTIETKTSSNQTDNYP